MQVQSISFKNNSFLQKISNTNRTYSRSSSEVSSQKQTNDNKKTIAIISFIAFATIGLAAVLKKKKVPKILSDKKEEIIPKYLYHMTSEDNYRKIMQDGILKKSNIDDLVYFSDIKNLINDSQKYNLENMLKWYSGLHPQANAPRFSNQKIVFIKVPVDSVGLDNITFRSVNVINYADDKIERQAVTKDNLSRWKDYPLEFLYEQNVPTSKTSLVNTVDIGSLNEENIVKNFLEKMFKNSSEEELISKHFNNN